MNSFELIGLVLKSAPKARLGEASNNRRLQARASGAFQEAHEAFAFWVEARVWATHPFVFLLPRF